MDSLKNMIKEKQYVPEQWQVIKLSEACEKITDGVHSTPKYVKYGVPFLSVNNLLNERLSFDSCKYITKEAHQHLTKRCSPKKGDVLMGKVATIGVSAVVNSNTEFSIFVQIALLRPKMILNSYYLKYFLELPSFRNYVHSLASGTTIKYIGINQIEKLKILLPPLKEQEKIVEILSSCDRAIELTEKLIASKRKLKRGLMQIIFRSYNEYIMLGDLVEIKGRIGWRGYTRHDLRTSGHLVIGGTQITKFNQLDFSNPTYLSTEKYEESPEIQIKFKDIILVKTGNTIGKVALVDRNIGTATINPNTVILRAKKIDEKYLYYLMTSNYFQSKLWSFVVVGAQPSVNQENIKKIKIPVVSYQEQKNIATNLSLLAQEIDLLNSLKATIQKQKKGLMQQLLTGKTRVPLNQ